MLSLNEKSPIHERTLNKKNIKWILQPILNNLLYSTIVKLIT